MGVHVKSFRPINDQVVVFIPKIKEKTKAGLIKTQAMMEDEFKNTPQLFEVKAIGEKVETIKVGQYVLCTRINRIPIESGTEDFETAVVRVFDIVGTADEV